MAKLEHFEALRLKLKGLGAKARETHIVQVGFTQRYAITVHEDLASSHAPGTQAKYLEQPARDLAPVLGEIVATVAKRTGGDVKQGLLVAGLRLQREAQILVPVDTSALRASAYTALEQDADGAASAAFGRSETIRLSALAAREAKK